MMITSFHLRPTAAELEEYLDTQPLTGTRMVFNPQIGSVFIRYTPKTDAEMIHFILKWSDKIHTAGSPANILANIIVNQSVRRAFHGTTL